MKKIPTVRAAKTKNSSKEKKPFFLSPTPFQDEFRKTIKNNSNFFCNSNNSTSLSDNEIFKECPKCLKDYCTTCSSVCHSIEKCTEKTKQIENNIVYEYASSCHCDHNVYDKSSCEVDLICFYYKFICDNFEISEQEYNVDQERKIICDYCLSCPKNKKKNFQGLIEKITLVTLM